MKKAERSEAKSLDRCEQLTSYYEDVLVYDHSQLFTVWKNLNI